MAQKKKTPFYQIVADKLIEQLKQGTAPWLRPWDPGGTLLPHNPVSGSRYKGANAVWLAMTAEDEGYGDPRWMTYRQAEGFGAQVRKGERGTLIQYWKFREEIPARDETGAPVLDAQGRPVKISVDLTRPKVFSAVVFNAQQIDSLPALERKEVDWDRHARAESILVASGADIHSDNANRAFYRPSSDSIHLPHRAQFSSADRYYATALHELGHWTGHAARLDRDLSHPFGSVGYAKEELRAEIASMILGDALGIGHDPGQHAAYVKSWIRVLEDDPMEILRASRDAETIMDHILRLERGLEMSPDQESPAAKHDQTITPEGGEGAMIATEKTYLVIPYAEKEAAKKRAGKLASGRGLLGWDKDAKSWFAKPGADLAKLARWLPDGPGVTLVVEADPREEFGQALAEAGLVLQGLPEMDGALHRVPASGDKGPERSGAYIGYLDGHPAGFIQNFRTGLKENWKSQNAGPTLSAADKAALQAEAAEKRALREVVRQRGYEHHGRRCAQLYGLLPDANDDHPYLTQKGIPTFPGMKVDRKGRLVVPLRDVEGKIWSLQWITGSGFKSLKKGAQKQGHYFVVGDERQLGRNGDPVIVAEGVATAGSLSLATGKPIVVAFDSGNLPAVACRIATRFVDSLVVVAGDDDHAKAATPEKNVGRVKATEAAREAGGVTAFPVFTRAGGTDWNDLQRDHGIGAVRLQMAAVLSGLGSIPQGPRPVTPDLGVERTVETGPRERKLAKRVGRA